MLFVYQKSNGSIGKMSFAARKLVLNSHSLFLGSRLVNQHISKISTRYVHLFNKNRFLESKVTSEKQDDIMFIQPRCLTQTTFIRCKSRKSNRGIHENDDDENSDAESDTEMDVLKSDRSLSLVKVQSLRLDSLIKGALAISRRYFSDNFNFSYRK